jgi:hypothetical protein
MMLLAKMADSTSAADLPEGCDAYAGYVDGQWPSYESICRRFYPRAHCISITVLGGNARFADVERGDLTVMDGAAWLVDRIPRFAGGLWSPHFGARRYISPQWRPGLYVPESSLTELLSALSAIAPALHRSAYCIWAARWTNDPPTTLPDNVDALQWHSESSANYDLSLCGPRFLRGPLPSASRAS